MLLYYSFLLLHPNRHQKLKWFICFFICALLILCVSREEKKSYSRFTERRPIIIVFEYDINRVCLECRKAYLHISVVKLVPRFVFQVDFVA